MVLLTLRDKRYILFLIIPDEAWDIIPRSYGILRRKNYFSPFRVLTHESAPHIFLMIDTLPVTTGILRY